MFLRRTCHVASIVTLFVSLFVAYASAQGLKADKPDKPDDAADKATREQTDAKILAALDQIAASAAEAAANTKPSNKPPDPYAWLVAASAVTQGLAAIAIVGFTLWLALLNKGLLTATAKAANAAKDSADAATFSNTVTHRPTLAVGPIEVEGFSGRHVLPQLTNGKVWITNTGVQEAAIQKFWADWFFWDVLPLVNPAHSSEEGDTNGLIKPGHFAMLKLPTYDVPAIASYAVNINADRADKGQVMAGSSGMRAKGDLYLVGCVKYRDTIGLMRKYFAYRWDAFHGRFDVVEHPNYNYEK